LQAFPLCWIDDDRRGNAHGSELRGKALAGYVLAEAQDGYEVVFSLTELDPAFIDNQILLADTANGKPLFGGQGRFRLVVPKSWSGLKTPAPGPATIQIQTTDRLKRAW
jgi:hypothetical protein